VFLEGGEQVLHGDLMVRRWGSLAMPVVNRVRRARTESGVESGCRGAAGLAVLPGVDDDVEEGDLELSESSLRREKATAVT